ncbi:hypothetical protein [Aestuariivita sp.]|jgi:hypothetical protein|uniref:hypothetical protein n=1 Tax=Aestuariivita sp. TaxID=1872407 RepID=UPI002172B26F|nr:hypothetical protein [Aestuariivita sp.]MCE8007509.1 hypothetical protein [Aestuariivita sp.]
MSDFGKLNYINVGPHGTFKPSGDLKTSPGDIDAIFAHLTASNADRLSVHFHGGLVAEGKGLRIAESMFPVYTSAGAHAVSFIWETGLIETLWRNLTAISETKLFQKLLRYAIRELTKRLGADLTGRGEGVPMSLPEIEAELEKLEKFEGFDATARGGAARLDEEELEFIRDEMELDLLLEIEQDEAFGELADNLSAEDTKLRPSVANELNTADGRGPTLFKIAKLLASVVFRVLRRYIRGRDHGLYPTVVEELVREFYLDDFGGWVWGNMKDVSAQMFLSNTGPISDASHPGTYFLERLAAHQAANPGFAVDLIGHSAGSIAICNLFRSLEKSGIALSVRNVVFLAPACTTRLMHDEVVARPERYKRFRMFTMSDAYEQKDHLVKGVYTRSLLYLISGVLEEEADTPIAGMERFWTAQAPFDVPHLAKTATWLQEADKNRAVMSVTTDQAPGLNSTAQKHGDFDNDDPTRASLTALVAET